MTERPRRDALGALALVLGAAACAGPPGQAPPSRPAPPRLPSVASAAAEGPAVDPLRDELEGTLEVVARTRELAPRATVIGRTIDRSEMLERLRRKLHEDVPPEVVAAQSDLLAALGTVPMDFDYEQSLLEMMNDQLAGFYEPDDRTMYLMSDLGGAERFATLAHELVHALQDQHFGLADRLDYRDDANDEQSAVHSLAEGDATSAMLDVMGGKPALEMSEAALGLMLRGGVALGSGLGVPEIIKRSIVAPYVDGVLVVNEARRRGGWAAVDALWARPPTSTEQLLHHEKWEARETAAPIAVPAAGAAGPARVVYHDIEGEQSLRILFEEWMPRFKAEAAATGWDGDRVAVFAEGERRAVAWALRFDDEAAAQRATVAFARGVLAGEPGPASGTFAVDEVTATNAVRGGEVCRERGARGPFAVVLRGAALGVVAGPFRRGGGDAAAAGCREGLQWGRAVAAAVPAVPRAGSGRR